MSDTWSFIYLISNYISDNFYEDKYTIVNNVIKNIYYEDVKNIYDISYREFMNYWYRPDIEILNELIIYEKEYSYLLRKYFIVIWLLNINLEELMLFTKGNIKYLYNLEKSIAIYLDQFDIILYYNLLYQDINKIFDLYNLCIFYDLWPIISKMNKDIYFINSKNIQMNYDYNFTYAYKYPQLFAILLSKTNIYNSLDFLKLDSNLFYDSEFLNYVRNNFFSYELINNYNTHNNTPDTPEDGAPIDDDNSTPIDDEKNKHFYEIFNKTTNEIKYELKEEDLLYIYDLFKNNSTFTSFDPLFIFLEKDYTLRIKEIKTLIDKNSYYLSFINNLNLNYIPFSYNDLITLL